MAEFNPYRQWLDLPQDTPNYYELLGLPAGEDDAARISAAAAAVRRKVCSIRPAEHATAWSDLLGELELAESVLTDPRQREAYNQKLGLQNEASEEIPMALPVSSPPPPSQPSPAHPSVGYSSHNPPPPQYYPSAPASYPPPSPALPDPMAPVGAGPTIPSVRPPAAPAGEAPQVGKPGSVRKKIRERKQSDRNLPVYVSVAAVGLIGLALFLWSMVKPRRVAQRDSSTPQVVVDPAETDPSPSSPSSGDPAGDGSNPAPAAAPDDDPDSPAGTGPAAIPSISPAPDVMAEPERAPPTEPTTPEPTTPEPTTPEPTPTEPAPTEPAPPEPAPPTPPEPAPSEPMSDPPTATEMAAMNEQLQRIRNEIGVAEFEQAAERMVRAAALPALPEQRAALERLATAKMLVEQFHEGVQLAMTELKALDEIDVGSTKVAVVEVRPDDIVLRIAGRNQTFPKTDLPVALGVAIANRVLLPDEPQNKVIQAVYVAVHPRATASYRDKAKEWLEEGIQGGADAESLRPLIDEQYDYGDSDTTTPPTPAPPEPTPPATPPTAAQVRQLELALTKVRSDLGRGDLDAARRRLETVADVPSQAPQTEQRTRLTKAAELLGEFHAKLQLAIDDLKPMDELTVPPKVVVKVVEVGADQFEIDLQGQPRTIVRNEVPAALAVTIAERSLGDDGSAQAAKAVFVALHPNASSGYRDQAKQWLQAGIDAGYDGSDLLQLWE